MWATVATTPGDPGRVVTIADLTAAEHGVRLSDSGPGGGPDGRHGLAVAADLAQAGRFHLPIHHSFPHDQGAAACRLASAGGIRGKTALTLDWRPDS